MVDIMKRAALEYTRYDLFAGDKGGPEVRLNTVKLVTTRKDHTCMFLDIHPMPIGTLARYEKGIVDGEWKSYYCCLDCMDKWMDEYE